MQAKLNIKYERKAGGGVDAGGLTQGMCLVKGLQRGSRMLFWVQISEVHSLCQTVQLSLRLQPMELSLPDNTDNWPWNAATDD